MSTPVVTEKWAGTYDCSVCRRKRLTASEFSKKAIEKHRKEPEAPMKCKSCVEEAAQKERDAAASKAASSAAVAGSSSADAGATEHECSACKKSLPAAAFSRSNLSKGPGKQRCSECVAEAEKANVNAGDKAYNEKLAAAKAAAAKAEATGTAAEKLATSRERVEMGPTGGPQRDLSIVTALSTLPPRAGSKVAAIEAERVTGLKPVVLGRGGRGRHGGRFGRGGRA